MHWIYLIHEFHNLSWITEINELFHDILIYWDAPVFDVQNKIALNLLKTSKQTSLTTGDFPKSSYGRKFRRYQKSSAELTTIG